MNFTKMTNVTKRQICHKEHNRNKFFSLILLKISKMAGQIQLIPVIKFILESLESLESAVFVFVYIHISSYI
jgi:hypothetical protein